MSRVRAVRAAAVGVFVAAVVVLAVGAQSASALSAWWHLDSGSRPASLNGADATNEVQEVKITATKGDVLVEGNSSYAAFPYNAAPGAVQSVLEGLFGAGSVEVSGGPGDATGSKPYLVKFKGEAGGERVAPITNPELSRFACDLGEYECLEGEASVKEAVVGSASGQLVVTVANLGDAVAQGEGVPVSIVDRLPAGLRAVSIEAIAGNKGELNGAVSCSLGSLTCTFSGALPPFQLIEVRIVVDPRPSAQSGEVNEVSVTGGGVQSASFSRPIAVGGEPVFGVEDYEMTPEEEGGAVDTQAGSHPFQLTTTLALNQDAPRVVGGVPGSVPVALVKDLHFKLPPGLIGNPTPFAQCPLAQFLALKNECAPQTALGATMVTLSDPYALGVFTVAAPVFNLEPAHGEPARFGFIVAEVPVILDTSVRGDGDYGVTVSVDNVTQTVGFLGAQLTLWGVPGDPRHDGERGGGCLKTEEGGACNPLEAHNSPPFLELPTSCTGPLQTSLEADSWAQEGVFTTTPASTPLPALDGCNRLPFTPSISVTPDGLQASTPTGLAVDVRVPQEVSLNAQGLGESDVKDTTVVLPEGVQISPAAADGLLACSNQQIGFAGVEASSGADLFAAGPVGCPEASKLAIAEIKTPLLPEPLTGAVYLAAQDANPFGSLIAMYIVAENQKEGIATKLAGEVKLDERTGQIVATFPNTPQVPFEEAKLHFFGGARAPLSTPPLCGAYTSTASVTPWSGNPASGASSTFQITSGPNGGPCASPRPFQPGFAGGTTSVQAGGYSPLTMTLSRPDADQQLGKLSVVFPAGISAGLRGVRLCEEPQAASGDCPAESQIGQVVVSTGLGGDPFSVETGKAYITGPYEGDPFGVDVVVPAVAGPFNLGTEVVRSRVDVDPTDAHLTVVSDKFPTMLDGIPLQLQHINVTVNRSAFVFNPTSCEPMKLTGELESAEGATASVSSPFQVTNCAALSFKPEFKVSTEAKTSRTEGATLHVSLTLPNTPRGTGANVKEVKVSLPKQLPSPLKTLQKACTEKVFAEHPASCPAASRVGEAHVTTPVLEGPLTGPAYFVSHGGAKYPELIIVLVGEDGVTVQVHGETFISKQGITTATFSTVPDVPFAGFELTLPKREYPALSANGNLCQAQAAGKLLMPTEMVGQNGEKITQQTKISVTGCAKTKVKKRTHHRKKPAQGRKKSKQKR